MGTDKGLLLFKGKPMVQHAIELLSSIFETVVISTNNTEYSKFGLPLLPDIYKNCGPMGGIYAILSQTNTPKVFIISCDMPFITHKTIKKILLNKNEKIVVATHNGLLEPLCGMYSKDLLDNVKTRIEAKNFKLYNLITEEESKKFINVSNNQFININYPEDLAIND